MLIGLIAWVILGFAGGLVCLSIDDWNTNWLDEEALLWEL